MLIRKCAFCIPLMFVAIANAAGQSPADDRQKAVVLPRSYALPVVVYQPDCPLRIEKFSLVDAVEGGGESANFEFRNIGAKPIQSYTISWVTTGGAGEKLKLEGPMVGLVCLMVARVEFDDGTVYSDESTYKALQAYFEKAAHNGPHQTFVTPG